MKITYINEAVRLPSREQKTITVDDIHNVNLPYVKAQLAKEINSELVAYISKFECVEDMLIPAYKDESGNFNFSLAINVESDLDMPHKFCVTIAICPIYKTIVNQYNLSLFITEKTGTTYVMLNKLFKRITKKHKEISKINIQPMWVGMISSYSRVLSTQYGGTFGTVTKQGVYDAMQSLQSQSHTLELIQICGIKICTSHNVKKKYYEYITKYVNDLFEFVDNILTSCNLSDDLSLTITDDDKYNFVGSSTEWLECICKSNISLKFGYVSIFDTYKMYKPFVFNSPNEILNIAKNKETFYIELDITRLLDFVQKQNGKYIKSPDSLMLLAKIELVYPNLMDDIMYIFSISNLKIETITYHPIDSSFYIKYKKDGKDVEINIDTIVDYIIQKNHINVNAFYPETSQRDTLFRMVQKGIAEVITNNDKSSNEQSQ